MRFRIQNRTKKFIESNETRSDFIQSGEWSHNSVKAKGLKFCDNIGMINPVMRPKLVHAPRGYDSIADI